MLRHTAHGPCRCRSRRSGRCQRWRRPLCGQCRDRWWDHGGQPGHPRGGEDHFDHPTLERDRSGAIDRYVPEQPRSARRAHRPLPLRLLPLLLSWGRDGDGQHVDPLDQRDGQLAEWLGSDGSVGERRHPRRRLGPRREQWVRRGRPRPEPQPWRLRPGQPALRHGRRWHIGHVRRSSGADRDGVERPAQLFGGCRWRGYFTDVLHAGVPAAARHGERQQRHALRSLVRRLPRGPRRVGRCRPEHRVLYLRLSERSGLGRAGRYERGGAAVGRRPGRRRLGRRQHGRVRRLGPGALPAGATVRGHLPQRRHHGEQRLQRDRRWFVPGHGRVRHGDRPGHACRLAAGDRAHGHPARRGRVGHPGLRRHAVLHRVGQLRRLGERPFRRHPEHERPRLHRGRHLHDHHPDPAPRDRHPGRLLVQRADPLGRRCG